MEQLPENYCVDDRRWIKDQLDQLQFSLRSRVCERYNAVYSHVYDNHGVSYQKECKARHEANSRLREFVEKYGNSSLGQCNPPPTLS